MSEQIAQQFAKEFVQVLSKKELELAKENDFLLISKVRTLIEQRQIELAAQSLATKQHTYELAVLLRQWWQKKPTLESWSFFVGSEDWRLFKQQSKNYGLISPLFADQLKNITDFNELFYLYASLQNVDFQALNQSLLQPNTAMTARHSALPQAEDQVLEAAHDDQPTPVSKAISTIPATEATWDATHQSTDQRPIPPIDLSQDIELWETNHSPTNQAVVDGTSQNATVNQHFHQQETPIQGQQQLEVQAQTEEQYYSSTHWVSLDPMVMAKPIVQEDSEPINQPMHLPPPVMSPIEALHQDGNFGGKTSSQSYQPDAQWFSLKHHPAQTEGTKAWKWASIILLVAVVILTVLYILK